MSQDTDTGHAQGSARRGAGQRLGGSDGGQQGRPPCENSIFMTPSKRQSASSIEKGDSRHLLEAAVESLPIAIVVFDRTLRIAMQNRAAKQLLPDAPDLSVALSNLTVNGRFEDWSAELRAVIDRQIPRRLDVAVGVDEGRPEVYLNLFVHPLTASATGDTIGGSLVIEDVTAHIGMERRLAVSERLAAVGKLAARVAHELNNPLDGILRFTNLALRSAQENGQPKITGYLEKARDGILRMSEITGDLLEFSRSTPSILEQATINKIVEDAIGAMDGRAREFGISVVCNFHRTDMPVARGSNLFQIFCNLIKNALDAMPDGGTLTVTTLVAEPDVIVKVADTGIGLPAEAERIFEPFFTTKAPGQGTGLGLAVCRELIEKLSGSITPEPNKPRGTVMTVRIPLRQCGPWPTGPDADRTPRPNDASDDLPRGKETACHG